MKQKAILIDANSFLYRSYYAISPVAKYKHDRSSAAIYGFATMLFGIINREKPDYIAVAFDLPAPTRRKKRFIEYQAKRPKMPPDLKSQVPFVKEMVSGFNIPVFELDGFDADDILATIAKKISDDKLEIIIVTSFKDALQLTAENIKVLNPHQKNLIYDASLVKQRFGVEPGVFSDFLALVGDESENIEGIPKIGSKTAALLLSKYRNIEGIIKNLNQIKPDLASAIKENKDALLENEKIATMDKDVPIELDITKLQKKTYDYGKLISIFKRFGFDDLLIPLLSHRHENSVVYKCVLNEILFEELLGKLKDCREFSFDTETTSANPLEAQIVGISFSFAKSQAYYIPLGHSYKDAPAQLDKDSVLKSLKEYFEDESKSKTGQNLKYDLIILSKYGVDVKGKLFDTMIASYMVEPSLGGHSLDMLSFKYLNYRMIAFKDLVGEKESIAQVEVELVCEYACEDADITLRLKGILRDLLKEKNLDSLFYDVEMKLLPILKNMDTDGVAIDAERFGKFKDKFEKALFRLEKQIKKTAGGDFNFNSPAQLSKIIFTKLKLPKPKGVKATRSATDKSTLLRLARKSPFIKKVIEARKAEKLLSGFVRPFCAHAKGGRINPLYSQVYSQVGKITSSSPNLHTIPGEGFAGTKIKRCFLPKKGNLFLSFDFSQIQLRVLAHLTGDEKLLDCFKNNIDMHKMTASILFNKNINKVNKKERDIAKTITYGILYGESPRKISLELAVEEKQAQGFVEAFYKNYPKILRYFDSVLQIARRQKNISTVLGRVKPLPEIKSSNRQARALAEKEAIDASIQGSASDIVKLAMVKIKEAIDKEKLDSRIALQVNDEILLEAPQDEAQKTAQIIKNTLENLIKLDAPLAVEVKTGTNWAFV